MKVDVRIISATNRELAERTRAGLFREDLYYRLNVFPIHVPALRQRHEDIAELARYFIERFAAEENKPIAGMTAEASALIERFDWPGNVRQLENTIFRAVVLCDGDTLDICDFPQIGAAMGVETKPRRLPVAAQAIHIVESVEEFIPVPAVSAFAIPATSETGHMRRLEDIESEMIRMAIDHYDGHMSEIARRLGIGRSTLYRKLRELGLDQTESVQELEEERVREAV